MAPPVAVQVTALLKAPVPVTVAAQVDVCPVVMEAGVAETLTPVTVAEGAATASEAEPHMAVYPDCAEWATQLAVPVPEGENTPACEMVPPVAVQVTALLKEPVPFTVAVQVEVCPVTMEDGAATTLMEVTVGAGADEEVTAILAEPETLV
jgi:hypothetical protein